MAEQQGEPESGFTEEALAGNLAALEGAGTETPPSVESPPQPAPPAASSDEQRLSFRDALVARGYDVSGFEDEEAILDHFVGQAARLPQLEQAARYGQQIAPYYDEFEEYLRQKQQAAQPPAAAPEPEPYWEKPPEWDASWEQYLSTDAEGHVTTAPNSPAPNIHHKYLARKDWERRQASKLLSDPVAAIRPGLEKDFESLKAEARKIAREEIQAMRQEQQRNGFVVANQDWLYQHDQSGQPVFDPATGDPVFSERGIAFVNLAQELHQAGMPPERIPDFALRMLPPTAGNGQDSPPAATTPPPPPAQPPAPTADEMKQSFLAGGYTPGRGGKDIAAAAQPHAPFLGPDEDAKILLEKAFKEHGITHTEMT